jgi:hypothetical protein
MRRRNQQSNKISYSAIVPIKNEKLFSINGIMNKWLCYSIKNHYSLNQILHIKDDTYNLDFFFKQTLQWCPRVCEDHLASERKIETKPKETTTENEHNSI